MKSPRTILARAKASARTRANIARSKALAIHLQHKMNALDLYSFWYIEHKFHPTRKWRFDLACPKHLLAVEIDGGVHLDGRHSGGPGQIRDMEKQTEAAVLGWRIMRFTPSDAHKAVDCFRRFLEARK